MKQPLGVLEATILYAAVSCESSLFRRNGCYGAAIGREIRARTGNSIVAGPIQVTLNRMEVKGLVTMRWSTPGKNHGSRPCKVVKVTKKGRQALLQFDYRFLELRKGVYIVPVKENG